MILGVDVSSHQLPKAINWPALAKTHHFVLARAVYGVRPDPQFADHVKRARDVGLVLGAYLFFRSGSTAQDQIDAFGAVVNGSGFGSDWLLPALDLESNIPFDAPPSCSRYAHAEEIAESWRARYGGALIYTNISTSSQLGLPHWLLQHKLWIAHYGVQSPTTPLGMPWAIWQHKVEPLPGVYSGQIDQNVAVSLPLITSLADTDPAPAPSLIPIEVDWDELRRDRDNLIKDKD